MKKKKREKKTSILRSSGLNEMNLENVRHRLTIPLMLTIKHLNFFPTAKTRVHCDIVGYVVVQLYDFKDLFQLYAPSANFERISFLQNYTIEMYFSL